VGQNEEILKEDYHLITYELIGFCVAVGAVYFFIHKRKQHPNMPQVSDMFTEMLYSYYSVNKNHLPKRFEA